MGDDAAQLGGPGPDCDAGSIDHLLGDRPGGDTAHGLPGRGPARAPDGPGPVFGLVGEVPVAGPVEVLPGVVGAACASRFRIARLTGVPVVRSAKTPERTPPGPALGGGSSPGAARRRRSSSAWMSATVRSIPAGSLDHRPHGRSVDSPQVVTRKSGPDRVSCHGLPFLSVRAVFPKRALPSIPLSPRGSPRSAPSRSCPGR